MTRKFGRSTFARSLIFKFEIWAILKFYCSKFLPSPKIFILFLIYSMAENLSPNFRLATAPSPAWSFRSRQLSSVSSQRCSPLRSHPFSFRFRRFRRLPLGSLRWYSYSSFLRSCWWNHTAYGTTGQLQCKSSCQAMVLLISIFRSLERNSILRLNLFTAADSEVRM